MKFPSNLKATAGSRRLGALLSLALLSFFLTASAVGLRSSCATGASSKSVDDRPYVILLSIDGFRRDYAERYKARNLLQMSGEGAFAKALIPSFPTLTFPNHYTIVTGLYPDRHGVVNNTFFDPTFNQDFEMGKHAGEGRWFGGTPLWVLAEKQDVRVATYSWPGSEAEIDQLRPSIWRPFQSKGTNDEQVNQVLEWMRLPAIDRPHLITMYFSDVDSAGHQFGPDSPEVERAVGEVDRLVGSLRNGLRQVGLPVNLIVVSDHGMESVAREVVSLWKFADLSNVRLGLGGGGLIHIYAPDKQAAEKTYRDLKGKSELFDVYRRPEIPKEWHFSSNPRIGDLVVVATRPIYLTGRRPSPPGVEVRPAPKGGHGYDQNRFPNMHGVFFAVGPNIRPSGQIEPFENIHVYPLIAKILKLKLPRNLDGKASVLAPIYRR